MNIVRSFVLDSPSPGTEVDKTAVETARNPVQYGQHNAGGGSEKRMGAFKLLTVLYIIMFVLMIAIAVGSLVGIFDNPLIDPGM